MPVWDEISHYVRNDKRHTLSLILAAAIYKITSNNAWEKGGASGENPPLFDALCLFATLSQVW